MAFTLTSVAITATSGVQLHALRLTDDGVPWHPLYLPYSLTPQPFDT